MNKSVDSPLSTRLPAGDSGFKTISCLEISCFSMIYCTMSRPVKVQIRREERPATGEKSQLFDSWASAEISKCLNVSMSQCLKESYLETRRLCDEHGLTGGA